MKLDTLVHLKESITPIGFEVKGQTGHKNILTTQYLENLKSDRLKVLESR
jgi:hypothetical protein